MTLIAMSNAETDSLRNTNASLRQLCHPRYFRDLVDGECNR
ncbi:hypothetical protein J2792_004200 [Novosphingobium capsulatum]|uniref:Uncharacterized protein n=1 Tax=Novosphingobium capsulatum TaxID=13688 RepID=A0ABU1MTZ1_9SPHN|nr:MULTISPECIES: hypothetical protein [unclassified Novosphingobium]MBB3422463.1 hypothetical protein [Novosphingobium sp. BK267]MBB3538772.1 hypothetical protein [Novosphingobium sp. BK486]MBB3654220.1 hypothetical protein [Novosphingobium sp. BK626]MDR6513307.1 hypothetical protein [Novosphingobium capsulatum]MBB3360112.1 hypothetical protein [Novosphingobium sp. BK256]